jgi:hypothetical protein
MRRGVSSLCVCSLASALARIAMLVSRRTVKRPVQDSRLAVMSY